MALCFCDNGPANRVIGIWQRKLGDILRHESASSRIQLVVKLMIVKCLGEGGIGDSDRQPQEPLVFTPVWSQPITIAIDDGALLIDPKRWLFRDIPEHQLGRIPRCRILGNPYLVPLSTAVNNVPAAFERAS